MDNLELTLPEYNAAVLQTASRVYGHSAQDIASFLGIVSVSAEKLLRGEKEPSDKQLEELADLYNIRSMAFFESGIPNFEMPLNDFRHNDRSNNSLSPKALKQVHKIIDSNDALEGLLNEYGFRSSFQSTLYSSVSNLTELISDRVVSKVRNYLNVDLNSIRKLVHDGKRPHAEFYTRLAVESAGFSVRSGQSSLSDFSGFMYNGSVIPLVFVNSSRHKNSRAFTIFHEVAHALLGSSSLSNSLYSQSSIEKACDSFASKVMAPRDYVEDVIKKVSDPKKRVTRLFHNSLLSRQASAVRLYDLDLIDYETKDSIFKITKPKKRGGGNLPAHYDGLHSSNFVDLYRSGFLAASFAQDFAAEKQADPYTLTQVLGYDARRLPAATKIIRLRVEDLRSFEVELSLPDWLERVLP